MYQNKNPNVELLPPFANFWWWKSKTRASSFWIFNEKNMFREDSNPIPTHTVADNSEKSNVCAGKRSCMPEKYSHFFALLLCCTGAKYFCRNVPEWKTLNENFYFLFIEAWQVREKNKKIILGWGNLNPIMVLIILLSFIITLMAYHYCCLNNNNSWQLAPHNKTYKHRTVTTKWGMWLRLQETKQQDKLICFLINVFGLSLCDFYCQWRFASFLIIYIISLQGR